MVSNSFTVSVKLSQELKCNHRHSEGVKMGIFSVKLRMRAR